MKRPDFESMTLYQWFNYNGWHYSSGSSVYSWQYTGRWC